MDMLQKALRLSVPAFLLCAGNSYASALDVSPNRHTTFTTELESTDSYQIARMVFLPDAWDDLGMPHRPPIVNCSDYDETSCPTGWKCLECTTNGLQKRYKKDGCKSGYTLNEDGTDCVKSCSLSDCVDQISSKPDNSSYTTTSCTDCSGTKNIKTGWKCNSGYTKSGNTCTEACSLPDCVDKVSSKPDKSSYTTEACTDCSGTKTINTGWACDSGYHKNTNGTACEKDCAMNNCSGFPHTRCPDGAKCSDCTKTASNCSTDGVRYKVDSCESGYELSGNFCIKKDEINQGEGTDICKDNEIDTDTYWCSVPVSTDCTTLGYKRAPGSCNDLQQLVCPFDSSKVACIDFK